MKRCFDALISGILLGAFLPLLLVVSLAILITDPGPIIYRHRRIGRYGRPFDILKFRTMKQVQTIKSELTFSNDPRITPLGSLLRASKIDELPQLFNVFKGDMSLVGPRPESPRYVEYYTPDQREVLDVRPGITGPAQILYRHQERLLARPDFEDYYIHFLMPVKLAIYLNYVRNRTFWYDLKVLVLTAVAIVHSVPPHLLLLSSRKGSRERMNADVPAIDASVSPLVLAEYAPFAAKGAYSASTGRKRRSATARFVVGFVSRIYRFGITILLDIAAVVVGFEAAVTIAQPRVSIDILPTLLVGSLIPSLVAASVYALIAYLGGLHQRLWRYASLHDMLALMRAIATTAFIMMVMDVVRPLDMNPLPAAAILGGASVSFFLLWWLKMVPITRLSRRRISSAHDEIRVMIVGAGQAGATLASRLIVNRKDGYRVIGFADDDPEKLHRSIHGKPVLGPVEAVPNIVAQLAVDVVIIALPSAAEERIREIRAMCESTHARVEIMAGLAAVSVG